jgi:hypothetical protein
MKYGYSLPERLAFFKDLIANKQQNSISKWDVRIGGKNEPIDVFRVPVELPKYRLNNTRTLPVQEQYIFSNKKNPDFFADVESDEAQQVQHELLKKLIGSSDVDKNLIKYFKKNEQTDPLILTSDGFVISGNRRLCTFRELSERFPLIRVAILPKLDEEQVDSIEDYFEQETDIKDPFSWIGRAMGYRRRMEKYKYSVEQLAKKIDVNKGEISALVDRLEIADRYLEYIGRPKDYDEVLKDEQGFMKIDAYQQKEKINIPKRTAFEKLSFIALANKGLFSDRMYNNVPIIYEAQEKIEEKLRSEFPAELEAIEADKKTPVVESLRVKSNESVSIIKLIDDPERQEKVAELISDTIQEVKALKLDKKKKSSVLDRVSKASALLVEANTMKNHETEKSGVDNHLDNLETEIEKLRTWASSL